MIKTEIDTFFIRSGYRWSGNFIAKLMKDSPVTPNQVTFVGMIIGLAAVPCILSENLLILVLAGILIQLNVILDFVDGSLAHLTKRESVIGDWLDRNLGILVDSFIFFAMTYRAFLDYEHPLFWIAGFLCLVWRYLIRTIFDTSVFATARIKPFHNDLKSQTQKSLFMNIAKEFIPTRYFALLLASFFIAFNKIHWFLLFFSIYGFLGYVGLIIITYLKISKGERSLTNTK